jgi:hypothetical protein
VAGEPFVDGGDVDGGFVADGELVVAGGDGAVAFEPVYAALHRVPVFVAFWVEGGRPAAGPAPVFAVADLVSFLRDRAPDATPAQVSAVAAGVVGLVSQYPPGPAPGPSRPWPGDPDAFQHGLELRAVTTLARGDHDRERFLALLAREVHLGGEPAAGAPQAVIIRLVRGPARGFGLQIPLFRAPAAC